jgi:hypothetical protein|tara:strand:- start:10680 stop:10898 length:219 start_codon:yes stop_codon:yes gene_type:complete
MIYQHKNYSLSHTGGTGYLYRGNQLVFRGDGYKAILMFIKFSNNDKNVLNAFKKQLDQREECRLKKFKTDEQ